MVGTQCQVALAFHVVGRAENLLLPLYRSSSLQEVKFGDHTAVIVEVSGEAFYTGTATFTVEEEDPLKHGFSFK